MKCVRLIVFCFTLSQNLIYAQFKNIKIAEIKNSGRLLSVTDVTDPGKCYATVEQALFVSNDAGLSWKANGDTKKSDSLQNSGTFCKSPNGEIYSVFAEGNELKIKMENTHSSQTKVAAPFLSGQTYLINGKIKVNGLPNVACDLSNGEHRGRIYVCWSDEKYGEKNKDVFLVFSDDNCISWTDPILVTYRPNHKEQFMPRLAIDQTNGFVYVLYYDQQNSFDGKFADVTLARSTNGGLLFDYRKINQRPIVLTEKTDLGSKIGLSVTRSVIRPLWLQPDEQNKLSLYTAIVDENKIASDTSNLHDNLEIEKTLNYSDEMKIQFDLKHKTVMTVVLTDPLNHKFEKRIFENKKMKKGTNSFVLNNKKLGVAKGNYTLTFYYDNRNTYVWVVEQE